MHALAISGCSGGGLEVEVGDEGREDGLLWNKA